MGRRKRRKQVPKKVVRKLPTIFSCPQCGKQTLSISLKKRLEGDWVLAEAVCGECGFCARLRITPIQQAVDAYGKLVDLYETYISGTEVSIHGECIDEDTLLSKHAIGEEVKEESEGQS